MSPTSIPPSRTPGSRTLNLGILAHVDAGKTSLTERLLFDAGVTDHLGSVDIGDTQTDTLELERRRGITIKSAVACFTLPDPRGDVVVNLVDTPGHPDFIAEVERVLDVLDAVILVVSAVAGVQPQTRVLVRALRRLRLPVVIFVNKIDQAGAGVDATGTDTLAADTLVTDIAHRLELRPVVLGSVRDAGTRAASFVPHEDSDPAVREQWAASLAETDDRLLRAWVERRLDTVDVPGALADQIRSARVQPVIFGSAVTGAGVPALRELVARLAPPPTVSAAGAVAARVFAVQRTPDRQRVVLARVESGVLGVRDHVFVGDRTAKITGLELVEVGGTVDAESVGPGRIARVRGLSAARIGDVVTDRPADAAHARVAFAPPTLETVIEADGDPDSFGTATLFTALTELADADPLINFRRDGDGALALSLYGEVQKEVIGATLQDEYGIRTRFRTTRPICRERVIGTGTETVAIGAPDNPFLAGVGLRIEPGQAGSGISYRVDGFQLGTLPPAFFTAIEETVPRTLTQGLHGWQVVDATVTLIATGYYPRQSHAHATFDKSMSSTAGDFRLLTPLVLMTALQQAGTEVLEPVHSFTLDLPASSMSAVLALVVGLGGVPDPPAPRGPDWRLTGRLPAVAVHDLQQRLPGLTGGEGAWDSELSGYRPVQGAIPERPRQGPDPLQRKEYLRRTT